MRNPLRSINQSTFPGGFRIPRFPPGVADSSEAPPCCQGRFRDQGAPSFHDTSSAGKRSVREDDAGSREFESGLGCASGFWQPSETVPARRDRRTIALAPVLQGEGGERGPGSLMCLRNPSPRSTGTRETGFSPSQMDTHPIKKLEGTDTRICWRTRRLALNAASATWGEAGPFYSRNPRGK